MSSKSILAALGRGECIDPGGDVQLLVELSCLEEDLCRDLQTALCSLPCQVEWQDKGSEFTVYVLADNGADQNRLLVKLAAFVDGRPHQLHLIETRLVQSGPASQSRHGFRFVSKDAEGAKDIVLSPGNHAFGSGDHPSTNLVIELLEEMVELPSPVLDVGCGTGVLSIVAGRLGARRVVGVDIDQEAVMAAAENGQANDLADRLSFTTLDLAEVEGPFALILANLTASVFYRLLDTITSKALPGGRLIVSGLQGRQGDEAVALAADRGWRLEKSRSLGKWQARLFVMSS